ncbi:MAG: ABC transporter ATP-binding protein [Candidatus Bathyarchaeota archaeon]|jgi:oligopeptide/dipeptide ABC transporter ATP-binding protein|nr:ABC transporter ATP-binding protein [Candidatus Bathyarchaeota archaeon]
MEERLLEIRDLKTYYEAGYKSVKAVDGIDLEIQKKEAVGLVGESGSGKSTVAWSIMGLAPATGRILGGQILFHGKDLLEIREDEMRRIRGKEIAMIFQNPMSFLNPVMKVRNQIAEALEMHESLGKEEINQKVVELLKKTQISSPERVADYYPHQLSGGMQQRVLISLAISCSPQLLIADEPTTALDATIQLGIMDLLRTLKEHENLSLLLITHDLGIVADLCDRLYVMYSGKILEYGNVYSVFENPSHPYTAMLLSSTLSIDEYKKTLAFIPGSVPDMTQPPKGCRFHPRCPHAKTVCSNHEPPNKQIDKDHWASCWLLDR